MVLVERLSKLMEKDESFREIAQRKLDEGNQLISLLDDNEIQNYLLNDEGAGRAFFCDAENFEEFQELSEYGRTLLDFHFEHLVCAFSELSSVLDELYYEYLKGDITEEERIRVLKLYAKNIASSPIKEEILTIGGFDAFCKIIHSVYGQKNELENIEMTDDNEDRISMISSTLRALGRNPDYLEPYEDDYQIYYTYVLNFIGEIKEYHSDSDIELKLFALESNLESILAEIYGGHQITPELKEAFLKAKNKLSIIKSDTKHESLASRIDGTYAKMNDIFSYVNIDEIKNGSTEAKEKAITVLNNVIGLNCEHNRSQILNYYSIFSELDKIGVEINELEGYKEFQKLLSELITSNLIEFSYYNFNWYIDGTSYDYYSFSGKYLQNLIDKKTSIFSDEGMVLRNYLKISTARPGFDIHGVMDRVKSEYIPEGASIESEEQFLDEYITNNPKPTDKESFDEFLEHLQNRKILDKEFSLPSRYVNYIMKQVLTKNNVVDEYWDEYLQLLESTIEDLAKNKISDEVKENNIFACYIVEYFDDIKDIKGVCLNDVGICVRRDKVVELITQKEQKIINLEVLFHEMVHTEQHNEFIFGKLYSYNRLVMQKEEIINRIISDNFYEDNYTHMFNEIEANEQAALMLIDYIDELGIEEELETQNTPLDFYENFGGVIIKRCMERADFYAQRYFTSEKVLANGENRNVHELFDSIITQKPTLLSRFRGLTIEYKPDGSKKNIKELLDGIKERIHNEPEHKDELRQLFADIMLNENYLTVDSFAQDVSLIVENSEELGDACPVILAKKIGPLALEFESNMESMQDEQNNISVDLVQKMIRILDDYSSRKENSHETTLAIQSFKKLEERLAEKTQKEVNLSSEPSIRFLLMASFGVTSEEIASLENCIVKTEEENATVSTISCPEDRGQDDEIKDQ